VDEPFRLLVARIEHQKSAVRTREVLAMAVSIRKKRKRRPLRGVMVGGAAGAAAVYFLDPVSGDRRRAVLRQWVAARFRGGARKVERGSRIFAARGAGAMEGVRHFREQNAPENEPTLKHKVESEVFADPSLPKGDVSVDVEGSTVVLRGQVARPEIIRAVESKVWSVQGVSDVRNLLHPPGTPPPNVTTDGG
jgi:hypothetical protein